MKMGNDRLYLAIQVLLFGEGDILSRVVAACVILHRMSRNEVDMGLRIRIDVAYKNFFKSQWIMI